MSGVSVKAIAARVLGTVLLAAGLLFFIARAPFLTVPEEDVVVPAPLTSVESPALPENLASPPPGFALGANGLSGPLALQPTLGLFEADFAGVDGEVGFSTSEDKVAGECKDAGRRYIDQECSGCGLLGDADTSDMLLWQQSVDGKPVVRSVSRHCLKVAPDGQAIVGTLTFGDDSIELGQGANKTRGGQVPLITGATRLASIRLGMWSATYDQVPQPAATP